MLTLQNEQARPMTIRKRRHKSLPTRYHLVGEIIVPEAHAIRAANAAATEDAVQRSVQFFARYLNDSRMGVTGKRKK